MMETVGRKATNKQLANYNNTGTPYHDELTIQLGL